MRDYSRMGLRRHRGHFCQVATLLLALSTYISQVVSFPMDANNQWPTFPRRNIGALAREGYLRSASHDGYKRSISTLAKNGQLPTFRSPYDESVKQGQDDETHEKRNLASIARLRSYAAMKRNIQAMARDGYPVGRRINQQNEKRSAPYALPSMERMDDTSDDYYNNYYQSPTSMDSDAIDGNDVYDFQQSVNPFMFPPMSQVYKRNGFPQLPEYQIVNHSDLYDYFKRGSMGLPVLGMYRPNYLETNRNKRYIMSMPDPVDNNDINSPEIDPVINDKRSVDEESEVRQNFEKRHIGSLARLGLLPSFRFVGGRYSRSGRARLLLPSQELYRKHSSDENFGVRQYIPYTKIGSSNPDDSYVPPPAIPANSHPTGRIFHRTLNNDIDLPAPRVALPPPPQPPPAFINTFTNNHWPPIVSRDYPKFYHSRSLKVPFHQSPKRYLLLPAVDNITLRKMYRNSSLPGRRKNQ